MRRHAGAVFALVLLLAAACSTSSVELNAPTAAPTATLEPPLAAPAPQQSTAPPPAPTPVPTESTPTEAEVLENAPPDPAPPPALPLVQIDRQILGEAILGLDDFPGGASDFGVSSEGLFCDAQFAPSEEGLRAEEARVYIFDEHLVFLSLQSFETAAQAQQFAEADELANESCPVWQLDDGDGAERTVAYDPDGFSEPPALRAADYAYGALIRVYNDPEATDLVASQRYIVARSGRFVSTVNFLRPVETIDRGDSDAGALFEAARVQFSRLVLQIE